MLSTITLAAAAFAATDIDDLLLLVALFAQRDASARAIISGQFLGIATLLAASLACALVARAVSTQYIGWMGLLPIAIGVQRLLNRDDEELESTRALGVLSVASITIANGGDNIGVYVPLFAISTADQIALIASIFFLMTGAWCALAAWLVRHPALGPPLRTIGSRALPYALIGIGLYILWDSGVFGSAVEFARSLM